MFATWQKDRKYLVPKTLAPDPTNSFGGIETPLTGFTCFFPDAANIGLFNNSCDVLGVVDKSRFCI